MNTEPVVGEVNVTTGSALAFTVTLTEALPVRPRMSETEAARVCSPTDRLERLSVPPVPRAPSRFELQARSAVISPSSSSVAVAAKEMVSPSTNTAPSAGEVSVTTGA